MIPFLDLQAGYDELRSEIDETVSSVLNSGIYIGGSVVEEFENNWANFCECKEAVGVANGFDALVLSLLALGIGPGDDVLVPAHTFFATWSAVTSVGARPVAVDVSSSTFNMDVSLLEASITENTKAVIVVHLYGQPADLREIQHFCRIKNIFLIEDAAQAHGAIYENRKIGGHSDLVCWSFYPGKNLGAFGDGGAVTTDNIDLSRRLRMLSNYGSSERYFHDFIGRNSRLDPLQAAILDVKLKYLEIWNSRRSKIANFYLDNITSKQVSLPFIDVCRSSSWHLFVIMVNDRDNLRLFLENNGISTLVHYPLLPLQQKSYNGYFINEKCFPNSVNVVDKILSLPIGPHQKMEDTAYICSKINDYFSNV